MLFLSLMNLNAQGFDPVEIKISLLKLGYRSMQQFCDEHGFLQPTVWYAIHRNHQGPLSIRIRKTLRAELGLAQGENE